MKQEEEPKAESSMELIEELKQEAKDFYDQTNAYRIERYSAEEKEAYVMNRRWIKKWKSYVNYAYVKRKHQFSFYSGPSSNFEPNLDDHPGAITNSIILVPLGSFLHDGDTANPENQVVRSDLDQRNDIRLVNRPIWEFFLKKYGGGPEIIKTQMEEKSKNSNYTKKAIEVFFRKVHFLCIHFYFLLHSLNFNVCIC